MDRERDRERKRGRWDEWGCGMAEHTEKGKMDGHHFLFPAVSKNISQSKPESKRGSEKEREIKRER